MTTLPLPSTESAVDVAGVSKRFRFPSSGTQATVKDLVVRRVRHEGRFGVVDALSDVSFSVERGQTLGIIGENGSGKTTLLRILSGVTKPDRGQVRMRGSVAPLLALGTGFNHHLTGRENAMIELLTLGMTRAQAQRELVDVIAFSELEEFIDAPLRTYSTGMAMRLAFAAAIRVDPDILLLDEILAVGDERFARKCTTWMDDFRRRGKTTILVTHSSTVVATQCDVALWLDNGRVAAYGDRMDVVRAYVQAKSGRPVAETIGADVEELEAAKALVASYRQRLSGIMPLLRIPLVGFVRQLGSIKGMYEDGWTDGALEFSLSPLRDVRAWTVHATVPAGTPPGSKMTVELDGTAVLVSTVEAGPVVLACESPLPKGRAAKIRIASSATVNHHAMGISGDLREMGPRIDEIVFDHDT